MGAMESAPEKSVSDLLGACARLKRALAQVQCAALDLHEAFVQRDRRQREALECQAQATLDRIRGKARAR